MTKKHYHNNIISLLVLLTVFSNARAQSVQIKVVGNNREALQNVTIAVSPYEIYLTGISGSLRLPGKPSREIEISCIGYHTQRKKISEWPVSNDTFIIQLEKNIIKQEIAQISIKYTKTENYGVTRRTFDHATTGELTGSISVIKIVGYKSPSVIKSFSFFIPRKCNEKAVLRLRVFHADSLGRPGADMLDSSIFIKGYKTRSWNTINLEKYKLRPPGNDSFFIGLELMPSGIAENSFMLDMSKTQTGDYSFLRTVLGHWGYHANPMLKGKNYTFYVTLKTF